MNESIRLAVVDDHPLFREGVVQILSGCADIEVVAQCGSAKEAVELVDERRPGLLVLDLNIPGGGFAALEAVIAAHPETKILMLTVSTSQDDVFQALRLGAHGYVAKGVGGAELIHAVRSVFHGEQYLSPALGAKLIADGVGRRLTPKSEVQHGLSARESEILSLVKLGLSNKAIGAKLKLSDKTVKHYMTNLFQKLHVRSRLEAALLVSQPNAHQSPSEAH
jgi:DNA-binding NarL/FixJ family response regulator